MNVYSDYFHSVLKYLKNTKVNINNLLIITGNFNIRDQSWDSSFPYHLSISNDLFVIADLFNLDLLISTNPTPTRYSDTVGKLNLVIDLMFLHSGLSKLNYHSIHSDWHLTSDHVSLTITISIEEEFVQLSKFSLPKKSEEEEMLVKEVIAIFKSLDTLTLLNQESLEQVVNSLALKINEAWNANTRKVNITKHSKKVWNEDCNCSLNKYRELRNFENWKSFKRIVKSTKRSFFDIKI